MTERKVAIITGGGKGIGNGIATAFIKAGYDVTITGRTLATLESAKVELEKLGGRCLIVQADGAKEEDANRVVEETIKEYGRLDVLINNAQTSKSGYKLMEHTKEDFDLAIYSGLYATFFLMKASFPYLKESKGTVINFGSGAGLHGRSGQSSYAAAKEGIRGLSRCAATEWGEFGIRVNVVCPLAMTPGLAAWKEAYPKLYEQTIQSIPLQHFADPETEIGGVCLFLASDAASYITGQTIELQGGSALRP